MSETEINIAVSLGYDTKGAKLARITGPYQSDTKYGSTSTVYRMGLWMEAFPAPSHDATPDFFIELDNAAIIQLRNALSALMFAAGIKM